MWSVAVTKSEMEFSASSALRVEGLETFLPYVRERVRVPSRGRAVFKVAEKPRWPRYLFVRTPNDEATSKVLGNREVRGLVSFGNGPAMVADHIIERLRAGCAPDGRLVKNSSLYNVGDILRFISPSPFEGRQGAVARLDDESVGLLVSGRLVTTRYNEVAPIA